MDVSNRRINHEPVVINPIVPVRHGCTFFIGCVFTSSVNGGWSCSRRWYAGSGVVCCIHSCVLLDMGVLSGLWEEIKNMNKTLEKTARTLILEGLAKLNAENVMLFKRLYSRHDLNKSVDVVVAELPAEKLDWALTQVENTVERETCQDS